MIDVNKTLHEAPRIIQKLAENAEKSRFLWKSAELNLEQTEAKTHMRLKAENPKMTQTDLIAEVAADDTVYERKMSCITMESEYRKECIKLDVATNSFISARKLAGIENDINKVTSQGY